MMYLISLLLSLLLSFEAQAANLYVNNSGTPTCSNGTVKASNSAASPWCDVIRAVRGSTTHASPNAGEAASAGDIVYITAGTYQTTSGPAAPSPLSNVILNPVNDGTSGSPITFQAVGTVTLTHNVQANPLIGTSGKDYIWWKGPFVIHEANAATYPDTGAVVFFDTIGGGVDGIEVNGNGGTVADNHTGVRLQTCSGVTVRNSRLHNFTNTVVNPQNAAAIEVYNCDGLLIEHNELYDAGSGVFYKAIGFNGSTIDPARFADEEDIIRYNLIYNVYLGLIEHRHFHTASTVYSLWYQNIIHTTAGSSDACISFHRFPEQSGQGYSYDGPQNARFVNNTCYGAEIGIVLNGGEEIHDNQNNLAQNNLFVSTTYGIRSDDGDVAEPPSLTYETDRLLLDRNWWYGQTTFHSYQGTNTFASFQSTFTGQEVNSTSGTDPEFVNAAGGNFHITGGSPALTAGRVVHSIGGSDGATIPVGAYITGNETIGIESTVGSVGVSGTVGFSGTVILQ